MKKPHFGPDTVLCIYAVYHTLYDEKIGDADSRKNRTPFLGLFPQEGDAGISRFFLDIPNLVVYCMPAWKGDRFRILSEFVDAIITNM